MDDVIKKAARIRLLALDVDGVLTDGRLYFAEDGQELKTFDTQDGHGIKMLQQAGIVCAIITGRTTKLVERRAKNLGIAHLLQGREDKLVALRELTGELGMTLEEVAYVGDDWPDLSAILAAGLGVAVANAHEELLRRADYVTRREGGRAAVREVCDLLLRAQNRYDDALAPYLSTAEKSAH